MNASPQPPGDVERLWFEALEGERTKLQREIHDGFCQRASAVQLALGTLALRASRSRVDATLLPRELEAISGELLRAIEDVQAIASRMSSSIVRESGLAPALQALAEDMEHRRGIPCRFECDALPRLPRGASLLLYRVAQEIIDWVCSTFDPRGIHATLNAAPPGISVSGTAGHPQDALESARPPLLDRLVGALGAELTAHLESDGCFRILLRVPEGDEVARGHPRCRATLIPGGH